MLVAHVVLGGGPSWIATTGCGGRSEKSRPKPVVLNAVPVTADASRASSRFPTCVNDPPRSHVAVSHAIRNRRMSRTQVDPAIRPILSRSPAGDQTRRNTAPPAQMSRWQGSDQTGHTRTGIPRPQRPQPQQIRGPTASPDWSSAGRNAIATNRRPDQRRRKPVRTNRFRERERDQPSALSRSYCSPRPNAVNRPFRQSAWAFPNTRPVERAARGRPEQSAAATMTRLPAASVAHLSDPGRTRPRTHQPTA